MDVQLGEAGPGQHGWMRPSRRGGWRPGKSGRSPHHVAGEAGPGGPGAQRQLQEPRLPTRLEVGKQLIGQVVGVPQPEVQLLQPYLCPYHPYRSRKVGISQVHGIGLLARPVNQQQQTHRVLLSARYGSL
ncbi:hypothetical protein ACFVRD_48030 [Streptomyces sp. NPDC057908]|uniref:hypothetical protein n=1 Tax=Streptomyces sp. NPDC057908 TaxID=3346276 RepID=UPI0036E01ABF